MALDAQKLASTFVDCGMNENEASELAITLRKENSNVMFRAILWAFLKFGTRATYDVDLIQATMAAGKFGELNPFQAEAKIVHTMH